MNIETDDWVQRTVNMIGLYASYFGENADKYLKTQEYFKTHSRKIFWNWAAALLGPIWLFYRKMYSWLLIWLLIAVPLDFIYFSSLLLDNGLTNPLIAFIVDYYGILSLLYVLISNLIIGCWGTYYFLQKAQDLVSLVRSKAPHTVAMVILAEKGNPSKWRLAGGALLMGGVYVMTYLLACIWLMLR